MEKKEKIFIVGYSSFAQIAYEYFMYDSIYEVVGFSVEAKYQKEQSLFGLPIVPLEHIKDYFDPATIHFYVAIPYTQLNRLRTRLYLHLKEIGYCPASYISSKAFVWSNVKLGEHIFIFENNTIQPFVEIGDNVVLWSGNHIGHHSIIKDNVFISSQVVVSGHCILNENGFYGVNATIGNNVVIAKDVLLGAGAIVTKNILQEDSVIPATVSKMSEPSFSAKKYFKVVD